MSKANNKKKSPSPLATSPATPPDRPKARLDILEKIIRRVHAHAMTMIYLANSRDDVQKGDPKVGGHPSACSSALHLLSLLHLHSRRAEDVIAVKPHASPVDHTNHYLLRLFREADGSAMSDERTRLAMKNLRHFSASGEPVFQSYHSAFDPDHRNFLPSGSVGIPPVNALYLAAAYEMAETQGYVLPEDPHFWCLIGDSEFREGSLAEAMPEAGERALGRLTWIVDYNRQSLDGHRVLNEQALGDKDCDRIERMAAANGWDVLQLRHGAFRESVFAESAQGEALRGVMEEALSDYEFQSLLGKVLANPDEAATQVIEAVSKYDKAASKALSHLSAKELSHFMSDLGGHDSAAVLSAYEEARKDSERPMLIVAHTLKGWGLECAARSGNHSTMISRDEVLKLRARSGLKGDDLLAFEHFEVGTAEADFLEAKHKEFERTFADLDRVIEKNSGRIFEMWEKSGAGTEGLPPSLGINLKLVPLAHTQWVLGQITAKLGRISDSPWDKEGLKEGQKPLSPEELRLKPVAEMMVTMAPDVGTSTNLNASMDGKIYAPDTEDFEGVYGVKDKKSPDIVPSEKPHSKHLRFEIAEANTMSCAGSFGKMAQQLGIPFMPVMTVYDFFIKRALDQLFYNAYWRSSMILVGTPSGVTLAPEGAQHAWKSDIQIANVITWEPAFGVEMDWIMAESFRRHMLSHMGVTKDEDSIAGRETVLIRAVTRALEQKQLLKNLKKHARFQDCSEAEILEQTRLDCLRGAYYLVDHRGAADYKEGHNVVQLLVMGALVPEALEASDKLIAQGLYANVIVVSSPDLLVGNLARLDGYKHLRKGLALRGDLHLRMATQPQKGRTTAGPSKYPPERFAPQVMTLKAGQAGQAQLLSLAGRRVPVLSVHDGEPGLLDNVGSVLGTLQDALAVRRHSKSGRPSDIYNYHGLDAESIARAAVNLLEQSAWGELNLSFDGAPSALPLGELAPEVTP